MRHLLISLPTPTATNSENTADDYVRTTAILLSWMEMHWRPDQAQMAPFTPIAATMAHQMRSQSPFHPPFQALPQPAQQAGGSPYWLKIDPDGPEPPEYLATSAPEFFWAERAFRIWLKDPRPFLEWQFPDTGMPKANEEPALLVDADIWLQGAEP